MNKIKVFDKEKLKKIIEDEIKLNGNNCDLNFIDVSGIKDMSLLFSDSNFNADISFISIITEFNGDISKWDTSNVINMKGMFFNSKFNGDISNWNTKNVIDMSALFYNSQFNGDIS